MPRKGRNFLHRWVLPNKDLVLNLLVLAESVGGTKLIHVLTESEVADLTSSVNASDLPSSKSIPKLNASISCASS